MTTRKALCLNMIVKNEMANLERCLSAVADHIDCWVIGDTGSSDGTQDFIKSFFTARRLSGELHSFPFQNFEQARNEALSRAYASPLRFDYVLFADADMELVVEDQGFRSRLEATGYRLIQRTDSGLTYWNTRLVRRDAGARYHGVTHEYLDVPGDAEELRGVWYKDHASGSNRVDKFDRDARLLIEALKDDPENRRYIFYLAQSYRDGGRIEEAAETYAKRAEMGGWDEEAWYARLQEARCRRDLGDDGAFLRLLLMAFNQRPTRAEPLYELARYYRDLSMFDTSTLFIEAGLGMNPPEDDVLFIEDFIYTMGFQEEYSIAANYSRDTSRKDRGFAACNWLALNRDFPRAPRENARANLRFYVRPANEMMPSFSARPIEFSPPAGCRAMNPSLAWQEERLLLGIRTVNYRIAEDRQFGYETMNDEPPSARNFLLHIDDQLAVQSAAEILPPSDLPDAAYHDFGVFGDARLFAWRGGLWCTASYRELTPEGWYEQVLARINQESSGVCRLSDWRVLRPKAPAQHEKNWMPLVDGKALRLIYLCDPLCVLDNHAHTVTEATPVIAADEFRGGSQAIDFDDGWLVLVHEVLWRPTERQRYYHHRFVWFDRDYALKRVSRPFYLNRPGVEFAAGLAWHRNHERLLVSYGVDDSEAWLATVAAEDVRRILEDAERLPSGVSAGTLVAGSRAGPPPDAREDESPDEKVPSLVSSPSVVTANIAGAGQEELDRNETAYSVPVRDDASRPWALIIPKDGVEQQTKARPQLLVLTYHKTGTTLFYYIMQAVGRQLGLTLTGQYGLVRKIDPAADIVLLSHSLLCPDFVSRPFRALRVVRDPRDIWVSGYLYHRHCTEQWCTNTDFNLLPPIKYPQVDYSFEHYPEEWKREYLASLRGKSYQQNLRERDQEAGLAFELGGYTGCTLDAMRSWDLTSPNVLQVKLEDVMQRFDSSLKTIFLHFGFSEAECDLAIDFAAEHDITRWDDDAIARNQHVHSRRISKWREFLSPAQLSDFERRYGDLIVSLGYPLSTSDIHEPNMSAPDQQTEYKYYPAPFLRTAKSAKDRARSSREFDARLASFLGDETMLPRINCFYEAMSETAEHRSLKAAMASMRAMGHPVRVWSYSPEKLEFLRPYGVELAAASDVVPRGLFERVVAGSEIRYFSDIFRYAVLYEHGGLWMDTDVVMLRPFPFHGDYFLNLQWTGEQYGHFLCGNVMYAKPYSRHLRNLYEASLDLFWHADGWEFGAVGPKLLSDYVMSEAGAELRDWVFSPMLFNSIDWTEVDAFSRPIGELADYLSDDRVFGLHLWNAMTNATPRDDDTSLISLLSDPLVHFPRLIDLADRFSTDKNRRVGNQHSYARIYDRLLAPRRLSMRRIMEIGLSRWNQTESPSVSLWQTYFPFCEVIGVDRGDFSALNNARFTSFLCDQSQQDEVRMVAEAIEPGSLDMIIDDGSHASADQQMGFCEFYPLLAEGGWYFIEDLDWQPPGEDPNRIALTKQLFQDLRHGRAPALDPFGVARFMDQMADILFFDSQYELQRANLLGGLLAIRKRGGSGLA
jgi:glycosyltransferase involved in cell wall biosynthesis